MTNNTSALPLIEIAGTPRNRGIEYGRKVREQISLSLEIYRKGYASVGVPWKKARSMARALMGVLARSDDALVREMEGIAIGVGVPVDDIFALNSRSEIIYACNAASSLATDGCTSLIAMPELTASGHVLHAQNWDWRDECAETAIVLSVRGTDGPAILTQTEAGILARCGLNSAGIGLTANFLQSDRDPQPGGVPVPILRRRILEQTSYSAAVKLILTTPKTHSSNLMLSSGAGEAVNLETVPGETFWIQPSGGLLVHANHFESQGALSRIIDKGLQREPCSLHRRRRVEHALRQAPGRLEMEHVKHALDDRFDAPHSVCAPPAAGINGERMSTVSTILMDVTVGHMWIARRPYVAQNYVEYALAN